MGNSPSGTTAQASSAMVAHHLRRRGYEARAGDIARALALHDDELLPAVLWLMERGMATKNADAGAAPAAASSSPGVAAVDGGGR